MIELNQNTRKIRVFLSSTFQDMQEERNYLVKKIFPRIELECRKRDVDFKVVDLRWGITDDEAKDGKVIDVCLDEIDRSTPYFIGLIGNRYGWIPGKSYFSSSIKERYPILNECISKEMSITEIEIQYGVLKSEKPVEACFFFKEGNNTQKQKDGESEKIKKLKNAIIKNANEGKCKLHSYRTLNSLGENISSDLINILYEKFPSAITDEEKFYIYTSSIISSLREGYHSTKNIELLDEAFTKNDPHLIVVSGPQGVGKSSLVANWHKDSEDFGGLKIVRTFVTRESDIESIEFLRNCYINQKFGKISADEDYIWLLDGITSNMLSNDNFIEWIIKIATTKHMILSINSYDSYNKLKFLVKRFKGEIINLDFPDSSDVVLITKDYLEKYRKKLTDTQYLHIANNILFHNISILKIFLNEIVLFGEHELLDVFMDSYLNCKSLESLIATVINRLRNDFDSHVIDSLFTYLSLVNYVGLDEKFLMSRLGISQYYWSSIYMSVERLVSAYSKYLSLPYGTIGKAIRSIILDNNTDYISERKAIVDFIENREDKIVNGSLKKEKTFLTKYDLDSRVISIDTHWRSELVSQYIAMDDEEKVIYWSKFLGIASFYVHNQEILGFVMQYLKAKNITLPQIISEKNLLYLNGDTEFSPSDILISIFIPLWISNGEDAEEYKKYICSCKKLPLTYKEEVCAYLESYSIASPYPWDQWPNDFESINILSISKFVYSQLMYIDNLEARLILLHNKCKTILDGINQKNVSDVRKLCLFKTILSYCHLREGNITIACDEYNDACMLAHEEIFVEMRFSLLYAQQQYDDCFAILKEEEEELSSITADVFKTEALDRIFRFKILLGILSYEIKFSDVVSEYLDIFKQQDITVLCKRLNLLGCWLLTWHIYKLSAEVYLYIYDITKDETFKLSVMRAAGFILSLDDSSIESIKILEKLYYKVKKLACQNNSYSEVLYATRGNLLLVYVRNYFFEKIECFLSEVEDNIQEQEINIIFQAYQKLAVFCMDKVKAKNYIEKALFYLHNFNQYDKLKQLYYDDMTYLYLAEIKLYAEAIDYWEMYTGKITFIENEISKLMESDIIYNPDFNYVIYESLAHIALYKKEVSVIKSLDNEDIISILPDGISTRIEYFVKNNDNIDIKNVIDEIASILSFDNRENIIDYSRGRILSFLRSLLDYNNFCGIIDYLNHEIEDSENENKSLFCLIYVMLFNCFYSDYDTTNYITKIKNELLNANSKQEKILYYYAFANLINKQDRIEEFSLENIIEEMQHISGILTISSDISKNLFMEADINKLYTNLELINVEFFSSLFEKYRNVPTLETALSSFLNTLCEDLECEFKPILEVLSQLSNDFKELMNNPSLRNSVVSIIEKCANNAIEDKSSFDYYALSKMLNITPTAYGLRQKFEELYSNGKWNDIVTLYSMYEEICTCERVFIIGCVATAYHSLGVEKEMIKIIKQEADNTKLDSKTRYVFSAMLAMQLSLVCGQYNEAYAVLKRIPLNELEQDFRMNYYFCLAITCSYLNNHVEALSCIDNVVQYNGDIYESMPKIIKCICMVRQGNLEDAISLYKTVVISNENLQVVRLSILFYVELAKYYKNNDNSQAEHFLYKADKLMNKYNKKLFEYSSIKERFKA